MKEIPLTKGTVAFVDDEDYEYLNKFKWHKHYSYAARNKRYEDGIRRKVFMHEEIMNCPDGFETDHKDGNGFNNIRSNLRTSTHIQNSWNRGKNVNNKSGYKGVCFNRQLNNWVARIWVVGQQKFLGVFSSAKQAAIAYDNAARTLHGDFAKTNFN